MERTDPRAGVKRARLIPESWTGTLKKKQLEGQHPRRVHVLSSF